MKKNGLILSALIFIVYLSIKTTMLLAFPLLCILCWYVERENFNKHFKPALKKIGLDMTRYENKGEAVNDEKSATN
jgi:hypothetical protein